MEKIKYSEILRSSLKLKKEVSSQKPYNLRILSNVTCNMLGDVIAYGLYGQGVNAKVSLGNYDNILQDSFSAEDQQAVIVHYDLYGILGKKDVYCEDLAADQIRDIEETLTGELGMIIRNLSKVPCVIFDSFSSAAWAVNPLRRNLVRELAGRLNEFLEQNRTSNMTVADIDWVIRSTGYESSFDFKLYNLTKTLYTIDFNLEYSRMIFPLLLKVTGHGKKAVIFDCDNTLWKGILGEDGFDGIDMSFHSKAGSFYHQVQQMAVWLSKHGLLIGLCSKNNPEDVQQVVDTHPDMALKNENIVVSEVNWNDKASNLKQIASELNIGLDSLVFVDDSPFEINLVREQLPQITCLQVPEAVENYPREFARLLNTYFFIGSGKADLEKTLQYKQQAQRNKSMREFTDMDSYLKSLNIKIDLNIDQAPETERVAQLTQKTNQFNLCTNRYTESQIEDILKSGDRHFISATVSDKFGDSGLTGVVIVSRDGQDARIDDFLMSCRIMGRNIERVIMDSVVVLLRDMGCQTIRSRYIPTQKNKPVSDFYGQCGFCLQEENGGIKDYTLQIDKYIPSGISYMETTVNN
ncbi:MAG: HAD-IIIC family phosphatase [Bacteroidales bacterium]|nr:HAD-IIIC family phosphatase [Bacteroidales bacterium]